MTEAIEIIEGVWGPEPFTFRGRHYSTVDGQVVPPPLQRPRPPMLIAGGGERVTLRQVARSADACNFGAGSAVGNVRGTDEIRERLATLRRRCEEAGRSYDEILRTHFTTWLMLAEDEAAAQAKLNRYYPDGLTEEQRATRIVGTPATIVPYFQDLADAGMQYFVVQVMDAADEETFRLLAREVAPKIKPSQETGALDQASPGGA